QGVQQGRQERVLGGPVAATEATHLSSPRHRAARWCLGTGKERKALMVTGYEVEYYHNVKSIAQSLNRIANCMEAEEKRKRDQAEFQREAAGLQPVSAERVEEIIANLPDNQSGER